MYQEHDSRRLEDELINLREQFRLLSEDPLVNISTSPETLDLTLLDPNFVAALPAFQVENGAWHVFQRPDLRSIFLRLCETGSWLDDYRGESPVTSWLNFVCPNGTPDVRKACQEGCERLLNKLRQRNSIAAHPGSKKHRGRPPRRSTETANLKTIGQNLWNAKESAGLTYQAIADRMLARFGIIISVDAIKGHFGGKHAGWDYLRKYASVLDVSLETLLTGTTPSVHNHLPNV